MLTIPYHIVRGRRRSLAIYGCYLLSVEDFIPTAKAKALHSFSALPTHA